MTSRRLDAGTQDAYWTAALIVGGVLAAVALMFVLERGDGDVLSRSRPSGCGSALSASDRLATLLDRVRAGTTVPDDEARGFGDVAARFESASAATDNKELRHAAMAASIAAGRLRVALLGGDGDVRALMSELAGSVRQVRQICDR